MVSLATDTNYGGAAMKGYNSDIIRFLRNDLRDVQVPITLNSAVQQIIRCLAALSFTALKAGAVTGFQQIYKQTFLENLPTKFLQHYQRLLTGKFMRTDSHL